MLRLYSRLNDLLSTLALWAGIAVIGLAVLGQFAGAVERIVIGLGFTLLGDLPPLLMPWAVFLLTGVLLRAGGHITVDVVSTRLTSRGLKALRLFVAAICFFTGVVFCYAGVEAVRQFMAFGEMAEVDIEFPIWWVYLSFPVGFGLFANFALEIILREVLVDEAARTA